MSYSLGVTSFVVQQYIGPLVLPTIYNIIIRHTDRLFRADSKSNMAPHAEDKATGVASDGNEVPVNPGEAPLEPGIKKNIAQGKMIEFPKYASPCFHLNIN